MKKFYTLFVLCFVVLSFDGFSQIKVVSSGNVGIDTNNPISRFSIGSEGNSNTHISFLNPNTASGQRALDVNQALPASGSWGYGLTSRVLSGASSAKVAGIYGSGYKSTPTFSGQSFGLYAITGNASSGYNYGVFGCIIGSNNGAAIYGATPGKLETYVNGIYAGYFRGKVFIEDKVGIKNTSPSYDLDVNGTIRCTSLTQTSDIAEKKEVKNLDKNSISNIKKLQGVEYKLKSKEEIGSTRTAGSIAKDTASVILPNTDLAPELYDKVFTGFIAQDVAKVYPDLVSEDSEGALSINYIGFIPLLVEALKEQQAEIDALKLQLGKSKN